MRRSYVELRYCEQRIRKTDQYLFLMIDEQHCHYYRIELTIDDIKQSDHHMT